MLSGILEATPGELQELQAVRTRLDETLSRLTDEREANITLIKDLLILLIMMQGWIIAGVVPVTDEQRGSLPHLRKRLIELVAEGEQVGAEAFREALSGKMLRTIGEFKRNPGPRGFMGMRSLIDTALDELRSRA